MSTAIPKELPGDEPDDVLFNSVYGLRSVELNRPKKLNSLNGSMARKIFPRLKVRLDEIQNPSYNAVLSIG
jgi:3-hydroxyisobutyryl-CoA hydrolase